MSKVRLDLLLVERGLAESRAQAQRLVMAGQVRVAGQVALKPSVAVSEQAVVDVEQPPPFVSRGGEKLQAALTAFALSPHGLVCADVGASTGGFSDCLLQGGARRVYAIDVGQGILHWKLRNDPRVVVMEQTNARHVARLPEAVDWTTIDASFISLKILLPVVKGWFGGEPPCGEVIALIKPQFEVGRRLAARGDGVIRDPQAHRQVLVDVLSFAQEAGFALRGLLRSPLLGPKGNVEFLAWLGLPAAAPVDAAALAESILPAAAPETI
ncbi:MAG: TlyA family RNA methyltransferase [Chloroflexi bacterium]|nr:TlyA family RNA methyltransferase [Chloroflexota bacterium]